MTPSFHDGFLTTIALRDGGATLGLRQAGGDAYDLELSGLEALQVDDLRQGNIVSELEIVSGERPNSQGLTERMERLFPSLIPMQPSSIGRRTMPSSP